MSGTRVDGRYTLDREVGRGASGAVWLAHDEVLRREVAVKRVGLLPGHSDDPVRAAREARLAARVNHAHVVSVFDLVETPDALWLVMEYVDGPSLSTLVKTDGPLAPDDAARLLGPVADALHAAHEHGVVHRDVKPSNILVSDEGAKLSDFGIARGEQDATLTQTGLVTGSPAYLAPEVATGGQASPASDVWAFGATLVHVLTGRPPYHREGADNGPLPVIYRIVHGDPPRPLEAGWLGPLVAMTMTADPAARPTMAAVRDYLQRPASAAAEETTTMAAADLPSAPPHPRATEREQASSRRLVPALLAAAAVVVAVLVGVAALVGGGDDDGARGTADAATSSTGSSSPTDAARTTGELEEFAANYVRTADRDPGAGFAMLTPDYQAKSPAYTDFWGPLRSPKILEISADADAMTVTYTYSYVFPGQGKTTETVTLELEDRDGELLIAGDRSAS